MEGVGAKGGAVRGEKMVTSKVRRGGTMCGYAEATTGEGHMLGVGEQCYYPSRGEYILPMR